MSAATSIPSAIAQPIKAESIAFRCAAESIEPVVLADIYREETNIVIWRRELPSSLRTAVDNFLKANSRFQTSVTVTPKSALASITEALGNSDCYSALSENIAELVDMFCCLFDLGHAGLRLTALDRAMCPKFHTDKVPCRLVTTYQGVATEWLPHNCVDRTKLGPGSQGLPDEHSGLFQNKNVIRQLQAGDVALLKGERWEGNEGGGLVHRSPFASPEQKRLLLTLDFIS